MPTTRRSSTPRPEHTLSWAEFDATVSAESRRLTDAGLTAGDRVVIRCASGPAVAVAVLGALRAGGVAVPVPPGDVAAVVAHCAPRLVVTDGPEPVPAAVTVVGPPELDARAEPVAAVGGGEDIALLVYTSDARAVCLSHRAVLANRAQAAALRPAPVTPVDRVLLAQPLFHSYGLAAGLFQVCWAGATAVLPGPGRPDPEELADIVARHRVSGLAGVPSTYRALLELDPHELRTALAGLRLCTCGGVPLPRPWATAFQEATGHRIVEGYGLTEAGPVVTSTPIDGVASPGSVGHPLPGVELRLLDGDGRLLATPRAAAAPEAPEHEAEPAVAEPLGPDANGDEPASDPAEADAAAPDDRPDSGSGAGATDVRATASRVATDVRAVAERGVAEFRAVAERSVAEVRAAAERSVAEVRAAADRVRVGDPVGDMIDDAQDVEGPADPTSDAGHIALRGPNLFSGYWPGRTGGPGPDGWFVTSDMGFLDGTGDAAPGRPVAGPRGGQRFHRLPARGRAGAGRAAGRRRRRGGRGAGRAHRPCGAGRGGARAGCRAGRRRRPGALPHAARPVQGAGAGGVRRRAAAHGGGAAGPPLLAERATQT